MQNHNRSLKSESSGSVHRVSDMSKSIANGQSANIPSSFQSSFTGLPKVNNFALGGAEMAHK
jgi:hypothetical protein